MANTHAHIALWAETVANTCPVCTLPSNIACLDISEHQMLLFTEETPADLYFFTLFFSYYHHHPCLIDKETEAQRIEITRPRLTQLVSESGFTSGNVALEAILSLNAVLLFLLATKFPTSDLVTKSIFYCFSFLIYKTGMMVIIAN